MTCQYLIVILMAAAMFAGSAYAACAAGSKTLFFCKTENDKQIEVCDGGSTISYSFGKPEKPDIALTVPRDMASTFQWDGIGRFVTHSVNIPDGNTTYNAFIYID